MKLFALLPFFFSFHSRSIHLSRYTKATWMGLPAGYGNNYEYYQGNQWSGPPYDVSNPKPGHRYYFNPYLVKDKLPVPIVFLSLSLSLYLYISIGLPHLFILTLFHPSIDLFQQKYITDTTRLNKIWMGITEYGSWLDPGMGEDNWLGTAIQRASWIGEHMLAGVRMANSWTLIDSSRYSKGIINVYEPLKIEYTPTFYAFQLFANYFGTQLLKVSTENGYMI